MATIFGSGQMTDLPIAVVDHDFSSTSRAICRTIDSTPTLAITSHCTSSTEAIGLMREGKIFGYVVLPEGLQEDMLSSRGATIPYYYHYALLSVGSEVASTLELLLKTISVEPIVQTATSLGLSTSTTEALLMPIVADSHPLANPSLDYANYLSEPFFFVMFQIVILLLTVYTIGVEFQNGTAHEWLAAAEGSMPLAILSKLLPQTILFAISGIGALAILEQFGAIATPLSANTLIATLLLIIASQSLALALFALYANMGLMMAVVSMVGSLGATLCGVTFPLGSMAPIVQHTALVLPIRHFTLLLGNELYGGAVSNGLEQIVVLLLFCLLPWPLLGRLRKQITSQRYEKNC